MMMSCVVLIKVLDPSQHLHILAPSEMKKAPGMPSSPALNRGPLPLVRVRPRGTCKALLNWNRITLILVTLPTFTPKLPAWEKGNVTFFLGNLSGFDIHCTAIYSKLLHGSAPI